ncbi:TenA family protein [Schaalia sp. ZJ405]|uniref:TenA family protein n=1 Tax=Schaalia sp. ZJ405 TaxID=2709403 RepID=UPI001E65B08D|nr:TenA family protein [Schaalia sp. ZJ405]
MTADHPMTFTEEAWERTSHIRDRIDTLPFVQALADGSLERSAFNYYMVQDALYLGAYGRALAGLGAKADEPDDLIFWSKCAADSIEVERSLHASHVDVSARAQASPTCRAYSSFLLACLNEDYAIAATSVLPCFWVYEDVGRRILEASCDLENHPYGDWIEMYGDPVFAEQTLRVRAIIDRLAEEASPRGRERMFEVFQQAVRYEWMFWDAAWRQEEWPV